MRYANSNMKLVKKNQKFYNPDSPLLIKDVKDEDVVKEVNEPTYYIDTKTRCFKVFFYLMFFLSWKIVESVTFFRCLYLLKSQLYSCELFHFLNNPNYRGLTHI